SEATRAATTRTAASATAPVTFTVRRSQSLLAIKTSHEVRSANADKQSRDPEGAGRLPLPHGRGSASQATEPRMLSRQCVDGLLQTGKRQAGISINDGLRAGSRKLL